MKVLLVLATMMSVTAMRLTTASPVSPNSEDVTNNAEAEEEAVCGVPAIEPFPPVERIVGGIEAKPNSWPWMCSYEVKVGDEWYQMCGCSVLNNVTLLTAAHCVSMVSESILYRKGQSWTFVRQRARDIVHRVRCGIHYVKGDNPHEQTVVVANKTYHELFNMSTFDYDVAILKLSTPLTFNDFVSPVCLPQKDAEPGTPAVATGWGLTTDAGNASNELRQVNLPIIAQKQCVDDYANPPEPDIPPVTDRMLCAGYQEGGKGTCSGDSGGPLVTKRDGVWEIQGINSWAYGCAEKGFPGVFTRVTQLMDWIKRRL